MKYKMSWSCSETKIMCDERSALIQILMLGLPTRTKVENETTGRNEFPHFLFTFHSLPCSFRGCSISSVWIWPVPLPHVLPALAKENLSISAELQGFSPAFVRSSHFILLHHFNLRTALHCLHGAITILAHITSISFPPGSTG